MTSNSSKVFMIRSSCPSITFFHSLDFPVALFFNCTHVYYIKSENVDEQKENQGNTVNPISHFINNEILIMISQ